MTIASPTEHRLTAAQQAVVDQPWDARVLVTAGAGAGKTHTLVRRLDVLVEREELEAGEILVLSFSRAAVRELTERIERHSAAARRVRVQTFDSWAATLLNRAYPDTDWGAHTYDGRIEAATRAIDQGAVEAGENVPAHVVIDEVQDLVGVRRQMVEALLDRFQENGGFTVVGDSAQAVYGFHVSDPDERVLETDRFLDWVRATFGEDLVELHLSESFRARSQAARVALPYGAQLQRLPRDPAEAAGEAERLHGDLRALLLSAPNFGDLDDEFVQAALRDFPDTTAILCRDNGQALTLSGRLAEVGVPHTLQRSARERSAPIWLAELLAATGSSTLGRSRFEELLVDLPVPSGSTPEALWRSVRKVARGTGRGTLDIAALHRALAEGRLPDELTAVQPSSLVISTVHRAKGLEFDRAIIVEPRVLKTPARIRKKKYDYDPAAEARLLYVAMTRARDDLYVLDAPHSWLVRKDRRLDRWYLGGRRDWARNGIELLATDVSHEQPPGAEEIHRDATEVREFLLNAVAPGTPAELVLMHGIPAAADQSPPYAVVIEGQRMAVVSKGFRADLYLMLRRNAQSAVSRWPSLITGLRVDGVEGVAGSPAAAEAAGLGGHGAWLVPRLSGLGRFHWPESGREREQA
ncbi:ATP-dependent helicase [Streptomyces sp. PKU-MA01144]|uniref:UvrD-helicase domain-containing protein n=1 Tax=Streptomyces TaxID=1883 RepID=UPI0014814F32|nr:MULTISPECIES: UvrD-helicase domain-containing protein [Streptomyces]MCY0984199.1 UvrD-helicase domain-containing protein [Streptomyces tirandamycinicus]NNJ05860.1 ATP-dependent helicase [Streptomyces sp. PKU-MA01144]